MITTSRPTFGQAIGSALNVVIVACGAAERVVKSIDNIASVAEETSAQYLESTRIMGKARKAELMGQLAFIEQQIAEGKFNQPQLTA